MGARHGVSGKPSRTESRPIVSLFQHVASHCHGLSHRLAALPQYLCEGADRCGRGLLLAFWGCMEWIQVGEFGGGNYTPTGNLAEWIDRMVLGRFRDGAYVDNGAVVFASWYNYTWVLSSITFGVTTMMGMFTGHILKDAERTPLRKCYTLLLIGAMLVSAGWLWGLQMPVIKKLWTSSMVLVSS